MIMEAETSHALSSKSWRPKKAEVCFQSTFKAWEPESWQLSPVHGVWRPESQENQQGKLWSEPGYLGSRSLEMEMSQFKGQRPRPSSAVRETESNCLHFRSTRALRGSDEAPRIGAIVCFIQSTHSNAGLSQKHPWLQHSQKVLYQCSGHSMTQVDWSPEPWPSDALQLPPSASWNVSQDQWARRKPGMKGHMELCPSWAWSWVMQEWQAHKKPSKPAATQWVCLENQEEGCICDTEAMDFRLAWYTDERLDCLSSHGSVKQEGQSRLDKK